MEKSGLLNVWHEDILVGQIWCDITGKMGFRYENSWINEGFPISQQMPLVHQEYSPVVGKAHQFFVNLLPEANARLHIVRDFKLANSDFELLKAVGGECAGAFSILPADYRPASGSGYQKLNQENFEKLLLRKGSVMGLTTEKDRPRLSLAGAQDKCPVFVKDGIYYLPKDASPSTHILKFEVTDYRNVPLYESYLAQLAKAMGIPTVECHFKKHEQHHYLLIKRYDRKVGDNGRIIRLHQEDFCQATGIGYEHKYQQDGGPSFKDCYHLIQQISTKSIMDCENLLKWQMFNFLAGNSDGHAKNLAIIHGDNQTRLAPFYDLVCTRAIARMDSKLAMAIGGEYNPDKINLEHWRVFAKECDIREQYLFKILQQMAEGILDALVGATRQFEINHGHYPALQRVHEVAEKQCKKTLKLFK